MKIAVINLAVKAINKEIVIFNCEDKVIGVIHSVPGKATVIIDGQYVLGAYDCSSCALDAITDLYAEIDRAERNYSQHMIRKFRAGQIH